MDLRNNGRAVRALRAVLADVAGDRVRIDRGPNLRITTIRVEVADAQTVLAPVWAGEGFPADVEIALNALQDVDLDARETPVVVARAMSAGARASLRARGLSWADEQGHAWIASPQGFFLSRDAATPARTPDGEQRMKWAEGTAAVAEYILSVGRPAPTTGTAWPLPAVAVLADAVDVSAPLVSRALRSFDAHGWTKKTGPERGRGAVRYLVDPTGLLSAWAAWRSRASVSGLVRAHAVIRDPETFVAGLETSWGSVAWALTGWLALERRAPFSSVPTLDVYVDARVLEDPVARKPLLASAGLREVEEGARVVLHPADRHHIRLLAASPTPHEVSDVRLYADLLAMGVRGPDAATHLRETRLAF